MRSTRQARPVSAETRAMLDDMEERDAEASGASEDRLELIRDKVRELRDAELEKAGLAEKLKQINITINDILWSKLPQVMDEAGVPSIGIAGDGNKPPYDVEIYDNYKANIPEEYEKAAFEYLCARKSGDLIKTSFVVDFGLGEAKRIEAFQKLLDGKQVEYSVKQSVPWNTLTKWFSTEYRKKPLPARVMAILGASVGRVARVKKQKEKK